MERKDQREDLTIENVNVGNIVYFKNDSKKTPTQWTIKNIFGDKNEVELIEQVEWWDDGEPQNIIASIDELYKEVGGPQTPNYGPQSPTYDPFSPKETDKLPSMVLESVSPNSPMGSSSFNEVEKINVSKKEDNEEEDGSGVQITNNLIRIYKKDGKYTDKKTGEKYDLEDKNKIGESGLKLLITEEKDEDEDNDDKDNDNSVKKSVKVLN